MPLDDKNVKFNERRLNMKRNAILHGVTALCSALVFAFFALPYLGTNLDLPVDTSISGYKFLDTFLHMEGSNTTVTFGVVIGLIFLIVAGLTLVSAVLALLCDFEVITNEQVANVVRWATLVLAVLLAVVAVLNLIACALVAAEMNRLAGNVSIYVAGWALTVITTVLGLGACGTTAYAHFKK